MSSPGEKGRAHENQMSRAQLKRELAEARNIINKQEKELAENKVSLEQAQAQIATLKELLAKSEPGKEEVEQAKLLLQKRIEQSAQLETELHELKNLNQEIKKENEVLKKRMLAAEENSLKQAETAKREKREAERQQLHYENRIKELESKISSLMKPPPVSEQPEESYSEDISAPKATFRIDLYPRQDRYQGKIEHTLTRDKKVFTGLDQGAIIEFISSHLPRLEEKTEEFQPISPPPGHFADTQEIVISKTSARVNEFQPVSLPPRQAVVAPERVASPPLQPTTTPVGGILNVREMKTISPERAGESAVIGRDQPFEIQLTIDLADVAGAQNLPLDCKASVYAKRLGGGARQLVGEIHQEIMATANLAPVRVKAAPLPTGLYRLEAVVSLRPRARESMPYAAFVEGKLHVC